ncbi:MAG: hypothetical protein HS100_21890 [Anaerolineales bacterium]|nr:hypothetical protein [Anaerolineales bacterium]
MKNLVRFTILFALLFGPSACGPRETWVYLVMGVMTREETSDIPEQFASYIEQEAGVKVVIHEQERWEPYQILENMRTNEELRDLVKNAEIITFDFHLEFLNVPEGLYAGKICGGEDNQDCIREAIQEEQEIFTAIIDLLTELRTGSPVLLRVFIIDDHYYQFELPGFGAMGKAETIEVMKMYYHEFQKFVEEESQKRGVVVVRALPDPYFQESRPPGEWLDGLGHYTEQGSRVITDELISLGLEFEVLK